MPYIVGCQSYLKKRASAKTSVVANTRSLFQTFFNIEEFLEWLQIKSARLQKILHPFYNFINKKLRGPCSFAKQLRFLLMSGLRQRSLPQHRASIRKTGASHLLHPLRVCILLINVRYCFTVNFIKKSLYHASVYRLFFIHCLWQ